MTSFMGQASWAKMMSLRRGGGQTNSIGILLDQKVNKAEEQDYLFINIEQANPISLS
jgi:hypothetical protein